MLSCFSYTAYRSLDEPDKAEVESVDSRSASPRVSAGHQETANTAATTTTTTTFTTSEQTGINGRQIFLGSSGLGGHLSNSTGTLMHLSPTSLVLPQNASSAPSSTALTPELKRPPNQKFVKHLEANLLKNSISDSQLNCTKSREERYIKVPIGTAIPPPRPNVPCPKKDNRHILSNPRHQQSCQRNDQAPKSFAPIISQNLRQTQASAPLHVLPQSTSEFSHSHNFFRFHPLISNQMLDSTSNNDLS